MPKTIAQGKSGTAEMAKFTYAGKDAKIHSKKQLQYDVKTAQETQADIYKQEAFGLNLYTLSLTTTKLSEFARDSLVSHEHGYLRSGYVQRRYGGIMPQGKPDYPEPGQPVQITAAYKEKMIDDITGNEPGKLEWKYDTVMFQNADAFIDAKDYEDYHLKLGERVSTAIALPYNAAANCFLLSMGPSVTLTDDIYFKAFLDDSVRPDQNTNPSAYEYFNPEGKVFKYMKKEIIAQGQVKGKNFGFYSTLTINPLQTGQEIPQPEKPELKANDTTGKNRYVRKDNNKYKLFANNNRFISLLAMQNHIGEILVQMSTIATPENQLSYDYTNDEQPTDLQICGTVPIDQLCIFLNPFDWADFEAGISNTSPSGNYTISLDRGIQKGLKVYVSDVMLPGDFFICQKGTFKIVQLYNNYYREQMNGALARQDGYHDFAITIILGLGVGYKGIGLNVCPPHYYLRRHFKAFKTD